MKAVVPALVVSFLGLFCMISGANAATPQSCTLKLAGRLPISFLPDGTPTVPIGIGGKTFPMILDIAGANTIVSANAVADMDVNPRALPDGVYMFRFGHQIVSRGTLTSIKVGASRGKDIPVLFVQKPFAPGTGGALGLDLLSPFDVEINLAGRQLVLFSHDHCPGQVVYWGRPSAVLPFHYDKSGQIVMTMTLDGKPVDVTPNLVDARSEMGSADAEEIFGITATTPGMVMDPKSPADARHYHYPFKALSLSGLEVKNPDIDIYSQKPSQQCHNTSMAIGLTCSGGTYLTLGRSELKAVRLYFAFKEMKLYVTAPDPAPAQPAP